MPSIETPLAGTNMILFLVSAVRRRIVFLAVAVLLGGVIGLAASYLVKPMYQAEAELLVVQENGRKSLSPLASAGLGGLALGGLLGPNSGQDRIAFLSSRDLALIFLRREEVLRELFKDRWDASRGRWLPRKEGGLTKRLGLAAASKTIDTPIVSSRNAPGIWEATDRWSKVMTVTQAADTGIVTLSIEWDDPVIAARWANDYISLADDFLRRRAINESRSTLSYLQREGEQTRVQEVKASLFRLAEDQLKELTLANASEEFAFTVVERALPPMTPYTPKRILFTLTGGFCLALVTLLIFLARPQTASRKPVITR